MPNMNGEIAAQLVLYGDGSWVVCATDAEAEYYLSTPQVAAGPVVKTAHRVQIVPLADWLALHRIRDEWCREYVKARDALRQIAALVDSEADEPLDDAIRIAKRALNTSPETV